MYSLINPSSKTAIITQNDEITYFSLIDKIAQRKKTFSHFPKNIFVHKADKTIDFIVDFLALLELEIPQAVLASDLTQSECQNQIKQLGQCYSLNNNQSVQFHNLDQNQKCDHDTLLILFTSGSSGKSKAVQLSKKNIISNINAIKDSLHFDKANEQTLFLPLSYSYGLIGQLLTGLYSGITTRIISNLVELKSLLEDKKINGMLSGVPSHYQALLKLMGKKQYFKISHIISAGAFLPQDLRNRLHIQFPRSIIFNNYGQTEAGPRILSMNSSQNNFFSNLTGYPVGDLKVKLNEEGELLVKGDHIMLGYLDDTQDNSKKISNGWLCTGDLAKIDTKGAITILGRKDRLIKIGGERISPLEIENMISAHPNITEAIVTFKKDHLYGIKIICFLSYSSSQKPTIKEIKSYLKNRLSSKKIPQTFYFVESIPKNKNGKINLKEIEKIMS